MEDVLDTAEFGLGPESIPTLGAVGITAPLDLSEDKRRRLLVQGMVQLAQSWGFIEADESRL
jgi:hypothetical protein